MASSRLSDARETITTRDEDGGHEASNDEASTGARTAESESVRELKIGKHVCPEEYVNAFTPMEFEEVGGFDAGIEDRSTPRCRRHSRFSPDSRYQRGLVYISMLYLFALVVAVDLYVKKTYLWSIHFTFMAPTKGQELNSWSKFCIDAPKHKL